MMSPSLTYVLGFSLCAVLSHPIGAADNPDCPMDHPTNGATNGVDTPDDEIEAMCGGVPPEVLTEEQFQALHSYQDREQATTDKFPKPVDAQKTPLKSDFGLDLGDNYNKALENKLTNGKNFNPLAAGNV